MKTKRKSVRRMFLDFNAIIHTVINEVYSTSDPVMKQQMKDEPHRWWTSSDGVFTGVVKYIKMLNDLIRPTELLYIASDGVVTKAKMMQQRQRSYRSSLVGEGAFDREQVKPGTEFMRSLSSAIKKELGSIIRANPTKWPAVIEFSDESIPGEGEHKIIKKMTETSTTDRRHIDVVFSSDSDMSILTMMHSLPGEQIVVMRQEHHWDIFNPLKVLPDGTLDKFVQIKGVKNRDGQPEEIEVNRWEFYDSTAIKRDIQRTFYDINDFALCMIFAGNDFVPGLPMSMANTIEVFEALYQAYEHCFRNTLNESNLMHGARIDWDNLRRYLEILWTYESHFLGKMYDKQIAEENKFVLKDIATGTIIEDRRWNVLTNSAATIFAGKRQEDSFAYHFFTESYKRYVSGTWIDVEDQSSKINFDLIPDMVDSYLGGIWWVLSYYRTQTSEINTNWAYTFHYPPTCYDLMLRLQKDSTRPTWETEPSRKSKLVMTPIEHLLTILPRDKLYLVPHVAQSVFLDNMLDLYPEQFEVDRSYIEFDVDKQRESSKFKMLLNFPSLTRIKNLFMSIQGDSLVETANKKQNIKRWKTQ